MPSRNVIVRLASVALVAVIAAVSVIAVGCGTTNVTGLWKDPSYTAPPLRKLLVIAFRKNAINRRMWEDAYVSALAAQKSAATAVPSYQLFPDEVPQPEALQEKLKDQGFDGVIMVARVERDTLTSQVPGYSTSEPVTEYSRKWKTYVTRYEAVYHTGYTDTSLAVSVRTDLLLPRGDAGQLVWSVTSKSVDPSSREEFRGEVAGTAAKQLSKAHLIP